MSASLVGSEMCIRDSIGCKVGRGTQYVSMRRRSKQAQKAPSQCARLGIGTVSYTHLTLPTICSV
eukprot:3237676-Alexandrium_andersonii.AAC.1